MAVMSVFKTTTDPSSPLDASGGTDTGHAVSDFLTVQSFTNFAAMTGAITAAWNALQRVWPQTSTLWVPYSLALAFGIISILISLDGLKKKGATKREPGALGGALFVGLINSLVLAGAVVGTNVAVSPSP
jgi:hypothetical protein